MSNLSMPCPAAGTSPLFSERLACHRDTTLELVLLSGWSMDCSVWRGLLPRLRERCHVTLIDLPGTGRSDSVSWNLADVLEAVLAQAPARAIYMGWSLGGNLALELAHTQPSRVEAVISLAANPRFVATDDWDTAMPAADFAGFSRRVSRNPEQALKRFDWLQCSGDESWQQRCLALRQAGTAPLDLDEGLACLAGFDQRNWLGELKMPVRHILGSDDLLVPASLADALAKLAPAQECRCIAGANHMLPLCAEEAVLQTLGELIEQLRADTKQRARQRDKTAIARSFSRAASDYDDLAELQKQVGHELLARIPGKYQGVVLDLGCGTGYFREALCRAQSQVSYLGLDLAEGMVRHARAQADDNANWTVGDAEDLPLASASVSLMFSSLALQWCESLPEMAAELHRVLAPGGHCLIATLGPNTLHELRAAWRTVDDFQHVNEFTALADFQSVLEQAGLEVLDAQSQETVMRYERVYELLRALQGIGARNLNADRPGGMTGRARLRALEHAYERWRKDELLPATYEVHYLVLRRSQ